MTWYQPWLVFQPAFFNPPAVVLKNRSMLSDPRATAVTRPEASDAMIEGPPQPWLADQYRTTRSPFVARKNTSMLLDERATAVGLFAIPAGHSW